MVLVEAVSLLILLALVFLKWRNTREFKGLKLPPGPFRWPLIGSLPKMLQIDKHHPYKQLTGLKAIYGDLFSVGLGVHYTVVISSYDLMKDLVRRSEMNLERFRFPFMVERSFGKNLGIVWSWGDTWTEVRKFTVKKLGEFGFGKKGSDAMIQQEMDHLMRDIKAVAEVTNDQWTVETTRLAVAAINVIWEYVGGYRFDPDSPLIQKHIDMNKEIFEILRPTNILAVLPFLKIFPSSGHRREAEIHRRSWEVMEEWVTDAEMKRQDRQGQKAETFVEAFLDEIDKNRENPHSPMTRDQLIVVLMDLFLAGTETISTAMNWMVLYFSLHPQIQDKARAEVNSLRHGNVLSKDANRMPYLHAFIYETMRHPPFGPLPPARQTSSDVIYDKYIIPKGTCIFYNLYAIHHDREYWGDPEVFRPERLLDDATGSLDLDKISHISQFGIGKRICPGESMAMDILVKFAATLLSNFVIQVVPGREPTDEPGTPGLSTNPIPYVVTLKQY